jgi:Ribonuclease G/E
MTEQLFISLGPDRAELYRWALGEEGNRLVQATREREGAGGPVGGIHLGRVLHLDRALNAAMVEIGLERPGLLPLKKHDTLSEGDAVAVQVKRDSREEKGVRLARAAQIDLKTVKDRAVPSLLVPPPTLWQTALKALAPERIEVIHCDRRADFERVQAWCRKEAPDLAAKAQHRPRRDWQDEDAGAREEIAAALQESVTLPGGGHLLFEPVRTLTAIDVNSGAASSRRGSGGGAGAMSETALAVNLEAAQEIPIQLALRNIGGVIVIDFIDIENRNKRDRVVEALREAVIVDPAIDWVGNMSRLGLVELRRRRGGPTLGEMFGAE